MSDLDSLLEILDRAYHRRSWHGTNLRGSLRGVTAAEAAWRPARGRHNIWEVAVHAAYWKYVVRRRLTGQRRGSFPLTGSDWFPRPAPGTRPAGRGRAWKEDVALLDRTHGELKSAVEALSTKDLRRRAPGGGFTNFAMVAGAAAHDLYHAGQIQLLKRLHRAR